MRISTLLYTLKQGLKNVIRNKVFSLASMATIAACIFLFGLFYCVVANFRYMVKEAEAGVSVTVFFDEGISDEQIEEIGNLIKKRVEVDKVNYISADEAWNEFKEEYLGEYADGFENDNPLKDSASYEIYLKDVSMQSALVTYLESVDGIRQVNKSEFTADALSSLNSLVGYISGGVILILLAVALFLISNTVALGISVRKEEIGIMKLIGATDFIVRSPFIIEGMVIGLIGSAIPLLGIYLGYDKLINYIVEKFNILSTILKFLSVDIVFETLLPVGLIMGIGIGFVGSFWTVRRHLKV